MGITVLDVTVNWHPCLHAGSCSTLLLKGLSCLLQPNSTGYPPVGFIVNTDRIRGGVVRGRDGSWFRDPSSPHPAVFGCRLALPLILVSAPSTSLLACLGSPTPWSPCTPTPHARLRLWLWGQTGEGGCVLLPQG